ncbi:hypothetical protein [Luteipulveratus flavus]|uniref:Potassium-transporting ATPase subunit F n=1 Tax=Luteipulveratus flavus TaxID=3031728 RepID=A0ABT6CDH5_9MICO|nr:hypothetical protein [Luteipulveratus sp. YIM 133296]MDF8266462.1 hypothetical protein [Luteipulveratus sp. YIM 133296]
MSGNVRGWWSGFSKAQQAAMCVAALLVMAAVAYFAYFAYLLLTWPDFE